MRRLPPGVPILTAAQMRAAEAAAFDAGVTPERLMEAAAAAIAREVVRLAAGRPILILAGPGNNGGDAYASARLLAAFGLDVVVAAMKPPATDLARAMAARWSGRVVPLADAAPRPIVVDGLLGIGAARPFDPAAAASIERLCRGADLRIAIDVPSGIDADTGEGGISVDVTVALGALKLAHVLGGGVSSSGHVLLADIGIATEGCCRTLAPPAPIALRHDVNKFSRGMVLVVAGAMPGAGRLAARAALHGGAGYVVLAGDDTGSGPPDALVRRRLETPEALAALLDDDRIGALVIGPGLGRDDRARALLDVALDSDRDLVIDGDALSLLGRDVGARVAASRRRVCLTPHAGEFARMFATDGSKIDQAIAAAGDSGAMIVFKGPDTVIAAPDGRVIVAAASSGWLSTAGSGDVLAGLVAARLSASEATLDAASAAVWLHARAASNAGVAFTADDLVGHIPGALAACSPI